MDVSLLSSSELLRRKLVGDRMLTAYTLQEVREAKAALLEWRADYPDDRAILEGGEILLHSEDFANEREDQRIALGMTEEEGVVRDHILMATFRCHTLLETQRARRDLEDWLRRYPQDRPYLDEYFAALERAESLYREVDTWIAEAEAQGVSLIEGGTAPELASTYG